MLPAAKRLAYIFQPAYSEPVRSDVAKEIEATAVVLGLEYQEFPVLHPGEIAEAITDAVFAGCDSLLIEATDILLSHRYLIASLAAQQRLPTISRHRGFVLAGASRLTASHSRIFSTAPPLMWTSFLRGQSRQTFRLNNRRRSNWPST